MLTQILSVVENLTKDEVTAVNVSEDTENLDLSDIPSLILNNIPSDRLMNVQSRIFEELPADAMKEIQNIVLAAVPIARIVEIIADEVAQ